MEEVPTIYDLYGRVIRGIQGNTVKDGSGTWYVPLLDSDGKVIISPVALPAGTALIGKVGIDQVTANANKVVVASGTVTAVTDITNALPAGTNRIGTVSGVLKEIRVAQVIDASLGVYAAGDVVSADDCCTTLAITWQFDIARAVGTYGVIWGMALINETPNQAVKYRMLLFNATPTGELRDNAANNNPLPADRSKYIGEVSFPYTVARGATVATYTQATPGDPTSGLPIPFKCAAADTKIYGVLVTDTVYTQVATNDIEIAMLIEQM